MAADFLVICGLSGAGRSQAAANLDDLGWFVIDNLPAPLIPKVGELAAGRDNGFGHVALVVRTSQAGTEEISAALAQLAPLAHRVRILFLDAPTGTLIRRYEDTRRRHPFAAEGRTLAEAIEVERALLEGVKGDADVVIDTGELNVHQLRDRLRDLFVHEQSQDELHVNLVSFGYKHGLPLDVDVVLDCRFLPNPHWVEELRPLTGLDDDVRSYVLGQDVASPFLERVDDLLAVVLPAQEAQGRSYLSIAFGCTGGRHRSVAIAEAIAERLRAVGYTPTVSHRDLPT
jgi:RNase adapter protein RapZ